MWDQMTLRDIIGLSLTQRGKYPCESILKKKKV